MNTGITAMKWVVALFAILLTTQTSKAQKPTVTGFNPNHGIPGDVISISGTNLSTTTKVTFNGKASPAITLVNNTLVTASVPTGATTGKLKVTNAAGTFTTASDFVMDTPTVATFNPWHGVPGDEITITGTNLGNVTAVAFNGKAGTNLTLVNGSTVKATVPAGATTGKIKVTNPAGTYTTSSDFVIDMPSISGFTPTHGPTGTVVTITGTNLGTTNAVKFNLKAGTNLQVIDAGTVKATVAAGTTTGPIKITTSVGSYTTAANFTFDPPATPSIASFSPSSGPVGTVVTISGNNLNGTTSVKINNKAMTGLQLISNSMVKATVASGTTTGKIKITTPLGSYTTSTDFTVGAGGGGGGNQNGPPSIASFSPDHGTEGTVVAIQGNNLTGATSLKFGGTEAASFAGNTNSSMTATVAAGTLTGKITVTTPSGTYTTSTNFKMDGQNGGSGDGGGSSDNGAFIDPPAIDPPAGVMVSHPRLFIRAQDINRLRGWAVNSNPVWPPLLYLANSKRQEVDAGALDADNGSGAGNMPAPPESYAELFAFMSLIHPDANEREDFGNRAHSIIMKMFTESAKGRLEGAPYRGKEFTINNRGSWYGEGFALTVDWIYDRFSADDKVKIRKSFLMWIQDNLRANTTAQEHPQPLGVINDPSLVDTKWKVRWAVNNYYGNHARQVGLMSMAMDAADDVPFDATDPPAGTLRRFVGNAIGAWLYQMHGFETTDGAGGISPEGLGYGELGFRGPAFLLLAMHTAGVELPAVYGAQATAMTSPYWDHEVMDAYLHMHSPAKTIVENWIGPSYQTYAFGDDTNYKSSDYVRTFGPLAIRAYNTGDMTKYMKLRWMIDNMPPGGTAVLADRIIGAFGGSSVSLPVMYFLARDPNIAAGVDPHAAQPTHYYAPGLGLLNSRTDWSDTAAWFTYKLSWNMIDHQFGDGNAIGLYRNGEWLTKPHAGYGANIGSSDYQNTLAIHNPASTDVYFWQCNLLRGSQWSYDSNEDPPAPVWSVTNDYTFVQGDSTNLYNNPIINAMAVQHASRSALWLKPNVIAVYDRATTNGVGSSFKRFHLNTSAPANVSGNLATVSMTSGQQLGIDILLPLNAVTNVSPLEDLTYEPAQYDPMGYRFWTEDPTNPADVRFLHVLQGNDNLSPRIPTALIHSTSGTPFEGCMVGTVAVMFKNTLAQTFTGVTFNIPVGSSSLYVTGLTPGAAYTVVTQTVAGQVQVTVTTGGSFIADQGGVVKL